MEKDMAYVELREALKYHDKFWDKKSLNEKEEREDKSKKTYPQLSEGG